MFIDSDFNDNSFGTFEEDVRISNFQNMAGYRNQSGSEEQSTSPYAPTIIKYDVKPSKQAFRDAGVGGCSGFMANFACTWLFKINSYGSVDADGPQVTAAFDAKAKTKNSYDYTLQEMVDALSNAQADVDVIVPYNADMNCAEYDQALTDLNNAQISWNAAPVTHAYDRDLRSAYLSAIANNISEVSGFMNARDCNGATSAIDVSQQAASDAQAAQAQAQRDLAESQKQAEREQERLRKEQEDTLAEIDAQNEEERQLAEQERAALERRNKMIMYGAGVVILLLILTRKK